MAVIAYGMLQHKWCDPTTTGLHSLALTGTAHSIALSEVLGLCGIV